MAATRDLFFLSFFFLTPRTVREAIDRRLEISEKFWCRPDASTITSIEGVLVSPHFRPLQLSEAKKKLRLPHFKHFGGQHTGFRNEWQ